MPVDLSRMLRQALGKLGAEKARIERQIVGLRDALTVVAGMADGTKVRRAKATVRRRKGMSVAARKAASARMKAYWAKRRGTQGKGGIRKEK
jgi:hypothetical protein